MRLVLFRAIAVDQFAIGERQHSAPLVQPDHDVDLRDVGIEALHEVLGNEVGPALLVVGILHDGPKDLVAEEVKVVEHVLVDFDEDDVAVDGGCLDGRVIQAQHDESYVGG